MNLDDLRAQLHHQANEIDPATPVPLPTIRRRTKTIKRRRAAAVITGAAAAVVLVVAVLPNAIDNSAPDPAKRTPDQTTEGITIPDAVGTDRLEKSWIGKPGDTTLAFDWTPGSQASRFATICRSTDSALRKFTVLVNGYVLGAGNCRTDRDQSNLGISIPANNALRLIAPAGKPAKVIVQITDGNDRAVRDAGTQAGLGIYRAATTPQSGTPAQAPPSSADDYLKDGIRYRAKVGGDTLLGAKIADRGRNAFELTFTAPGGPISLNVFCTAVNGDRWGQLALRVKFDGREAGRISCAGDSVDAGSGPGWIPGEPPPAGQRVNVTVRLEERYGGSLATNPHDWIGLGIYAKGNQRTIGTAKLDEVREYGGRTYRLKNVKTVPRSTAGQVALATPADTPFLISYGNTGTLEAPATVHLNGLSRSSSNTAGGIATVGEAARPSGTVKVTVGGSRQTTGSLVLALYLPE